MNQTKKILYSIITILLCIFSNKIANSQNFGLPYIQNFGVKEYHAATQNWGFIENSDGILYVANGDGVLEFDGKNWSSFKLPNLSSVRSYCKDKNGKMFVGAQNEIGFLQSDSLGKNKYVSLIDKIPVKDREFSDVWKIYKANNQFVVQTSKKIFVLNDNSTDSFTVIKTEKVFHKSFYVNNNLYVREHGIGLKVLKNKSLILIPNGLFFADKIIQSMISLENNKNLIITRANGIFIYDINCKDTTKIFTKIEATELDSLNSENNLFCAIKLKTGNYAFGTLLNGIIITDKNFNVKYKINKLLGLCDNQVLNLYEDKYNNLWVATGNEISYIILNSKLSTLTDKSGIQGVSYYTCVHEGTLYTGGSDGLFYFDNDNKFQRIPGIETQVWSISEHKDQLLFVNRDGFYSLKDLKPEKGNLTDNVWNFRTIPGKEELLAGTYLLGLVKMNRENNVWNAIKIKGYKESSRFFEIDENLNIWLTDQNLGIYKFTLNADFDSIVKSELYNSEKGLPDNAKNYISLIKDINNKEVISAATTKGIYYYNYKKNIFEPNIEINKLIGNNQFDIFLQDNKKRIWYQFDKGNGFGKGYLTQKTDGTFSKEETIFKKFTDVYAENISISDKDVFFNTGEGLIIYEDGKKTSNISYNTFIRKIYVNDSVVYYGNNSSFTNIQNKFSYKNNTIRFDFASPYFENPEKTLYSWQLDGFDKDKSEWQLKTEKEYTNLPEGFYVFKVKAKNVYGIESTVAKYEFTIEAPWYRTIIAYFIFSIIAILLFWILLKINTRRLLNDKKKLEEIVKLRTSEIYQQKEEIEAQSENLKEINTLLVERNEEVKQQNEEIRTIADNLSEANDKIINVNADLEKANYEISDHNRKITESINYALNIQKAVLPSDDEISELLEEYFIFYQPKDIVSGDFYWIKKIENHLIIVCADCTGHGVPGGFMSMLGVSLLNEIIIDKRFTDSDKILNELRFQLKSSLGQNSINSRSRDGMDICLAVVDLNTKILQFSGANNPLFILRLDESKMELIELKPDKMPIGIHLKEKLFTKQEFQLEKSDTIYLFTDGYIDQFSGKTNEKFKKTRFIELLKKINHLPLSAQKTIITEEYLTWKANFQQVDDILVMGVRI